MSRTDGTGGPPDSAPQNAAGARPPVPRVLCDVGSLTGEGTAAAGAAWALAEPGRQLDANVIRMPPGKRIDTHTEPDLDVLLLVVAGDGVLGTDTGQPPQPLREGMLLWLPHGSSRSITAGEDGLAHLTVHRRRPGMHIRARPDAPS